MKCPKCNCEVKDGFLLCSNCGAELSYVPTFDAQIEVEMDKALSNVNLEIQDTVDLSGHPEIELTKDLSGNPGNELTKDLSKTTDISDLYSKLGKKERRNSVINKKLIITILLIVILSIVLSVFIRKQLLSNSYDSIVKRAEALVSSGDYEEAIPLFLSAVSKSESTDQVRYELANAYFLTSDYAGSKEQLISLIDQNPSYRDAYALLITIYESESDYDKICQLLSNCPDSAIYNEFRDYVAPSPGFSADEGEYDTDLRLSLLVDTQGSIYYTLDGSEPDENSTLYTEPIILPEGKNIVRAIFVNNYGIKSESVSKIYNITRAIPMAPEVLPESGEFFSPEYIRVQKEDGKTVYYTTDGTIPDENSLEYIDPIPMKNGETVYKFISIDEKGIKSEISTNTYELKLDTGFSEAEAVNYLVNNFTVSGKLADVSGVAANLSGMYLYKCIGTAASNKKICFIIEEYYKGLDSDKYQPTDNYYGVDISDATIYSALRNEDKIFYFE